METFSNSSFFREKRAPTLPSPAEIRAINQQSCEHVNFNRPPPVKFPSIGLFVKYGADVTISEAETQIMLLERFRGSLPVPEVYGWAEDGGQIFVYMELIKGDTLMERWGSMNAVEKQDVLNELHDLFKLLRSLKQDTSDQYIDSINKRPLNDLFTINAGITGPFLGGDAVQQFHDACGMEIAHPVPIVFSHNDLLPPNVMISPGPSPKVVALIDWTQSGWYPAYWEYCKTSRVSVHPKFFPETYMKEWHDSLRKIVDQVEEVVYNSWLYFFLSRGI